MSGETPGPIEVPLRDAAACRSKFGLAGLPVGKTGLPSYAAATDENLLSAES